MSRFKDYNFGSHGGGGFGGKDLDYLQSQGASQGEINNLVKRAESQGLNIGGRVRAYQGGGGGGGGGGGSQGGSSPMPAPKTRFGNFNYGGYGQAGFGKEDLEYLQSQGATYSEIGQIAKEASDMGMNIGDEVRAYGANRPKPTRDLLKNFHGIWSSANLPGVTLTERTNDDDVRALTGKNLNAGQYYDNGKYQVVAGNARQPGWGDFVTPGYEKVGYTTSSIYRPPSKFGSWSKDVGKNLLILRKMQEEALPWPDLPANRPQAAAAPEPVIEEDDWEPVIDEGDEDLDLSIPANNSPADNSLSSGLGGRGLESKATGFRMARSSRKKAGRKAQGIVSQKKSPFSSWRT